jgi:hypothetical protein
MLAALKRRRTGSQLAYRSGDSWTELSAEEVNAYLKRRSGGEFTAKDVRADAARDWQAGRLGRCPMCGVDAAVIFGEGPFDERGR